MVTVAVPYLFRMGKTTLLLHIAERKLSIPPNIDVLYCEQGMSSAMCPCAFSLRPTLSLPLFPPSHPPSSRGES